MKPGDIFFECDSKIVERRKAGDSPKQLLQVRQRFEPFEAGCLQCNHVARVCWEAGLPLTKTQYRRMHNHEHSIPEDGRKIDCENWTSKWFGKKLIKFHSDAPHPHQLLGDRPPFPKKLASLSAKNEKMVSREGMR